MASDQTFPVKNPPQDGATSAVAVGSSPLPTETHPAGQGTNATGPGSSATPAAGHPATGKSNGMLRAGIVVVVLAIIAYFAVPTIRLALNTVSTDDAYVNSHVTFVAPRVSGQVTKVLVDDNNRVRKGDLVVQLDREPYEVMLNIRQAAVDSASADLLAARDQVRAIAAQARSNRFKLQRAIEDVNNKIALLRANVATWESKKATLARAQADLDRNKPLVGKGVISRQDFDRFEESFRVAEADVKQSLEQIYQVRVALGLLPTPAEGSDLTQVPPDLDQTFSSVRQAVGDLMQSVAPLSVLPSSYDATPKQLVEDFYKRDPDGNIDRIYSELIKGAPLIKQAEAKLAQANRDLDQAKLNLRYCDVFAEIDGVVTRRNVNPGNNVQAGQGLMAIRSLTEVWIDANFKETQLANLRIGQRVELEVDMYGRHRKFEGRITGFTMGTGSTLALLPAQNATGNFIKVVQRLPVRIEPTHYTPDSDPLFVGLSVVPRVFIREPATGPDAGKVLQPNLFTTPLPASTRDVANGGGATHGTPTKEAAKETAP